MKDNIAKIRAALELARDYITSDLASERGAFEGYEGVSRIGEIKADLTNNEEALAALAELEKAEAVYLVATGETYEGAETYTRHDVAPELCDCEKLYTAPPPAKPAVGMFTADEMEIAYFDGYDDCYQAIDRKRLDWRAAWPDSDTFKLVQERTK